MKTIKWWHLHGQAFTYLQPLAIKVLSQYTDEEVVNHYEEFYEDVHTEFLKFGELVNFKVCNNGSSHLRGNVYVHYQSLESAVSAYNAINGRFFAGKQVTCEFVGVMRWRVAICGEYMKSDHKNCSRGSACNFLHCFRNPGGEYEWADWDSQPPRSWVKKMDMLFGGSRVDRYDHRKLTDQDHWNYYGHSVRRIQSRSSCNSSSMQHKSHERDNCSSGEDRGTPIREFSSGRKYSGKEEREQRSELDRSCATYDRSNCRSSSRWRKRLHERNLCSSDEDKRIPLSEHSGGRKNHVTKEREQRSDLDHTCASYISSRYRSSSRKHKSHERDSCSNDVERGTPIREYLGGRKYRGKEEREQRSDMDETCATYQPSSYRSSSRLHKPHERDSCSSDEERGTPIRERSGGRKYSDEERGKGLNLNQNSATYKRRVIRRSPSHDKGGLEKSENDYLATSEEDIKSRDCHQTKRKKHFREHTCEDEYDDKARSVVGVDMDLAGGFQCERRNESCIHFESDMDKFKSNDRESVQRDDVKSSHYKNVQKRKASRRAQDRLELEKVDQEKMKLSRSGYNCEQMPGKHEDPKKIPRRHQYSKSPVRKRKCNWVESGGKSQSVSPDEGNHNNMLPSRSGNSSCRAPKRSLDEGSLAILDRWQARDDPEV